MKDQNGDSGTCEEVLVAESTPRLAGRIASSTGCLEMRAAGNDNIRGVGKGQVIYYKGRLA